MIEQICFFIGRQHHIYILKLFFGKTTVHVTDIETWRCSRSRSYKAKDFPVKDFGLVILPLGTGREVVKRSKESVSK